MKTKDKKQSKIGEFLSDNSIPSEKRIDVLQVTLQEGSPDSILLKGEILEALERCRANAIYQQLIKDFKSGPLRGGTFLSCTTDEETGINTAEVILEEGNLVYSVMPENMAPDSLEKGDRVLLDGRGQVVLKKIPDALRIGDEAIFERSLDYGRVEVTIRDQERWVYMASRELEKKISSGEVKPGDTLVVNPRQLMALDVLPSNKDEGRFQFLTDEPVPNVIASRDIGNPSPIIERLEKHFIIEMKNPEIRRKYKLPRSIMNLLTGIAGSGKTLAIEAVWRKMYEIMSEVTGVPIDQLPQRVVRLRASNLLSQWFGQTESQIEKFMDQLIQLSRQRWTAPNGIEYELPVLAIIEEIDGLFRARGGDQLYDRILTTFLQRLDPNRADLQDRLIVFVGTTNIIEACDAAILRRLGSNIEKFGRLDRSGFATVLEKQIAELPVARTLENGSHDSIVLDITSWLFSRNGSDSGVVELTYAGSTTPEIRYRRDFLTGALVNRAVKQAAEKASNDAYDGLNGSGIHLEHLVEAIDRQVLTTVDQLSVHNAARYVEVPDGVRIANLKRLPQPGKFPMQLQSN